MPQASPYNVPVASVAPVIDRIGALAPFEQDQLNRLVNQVLASSDRVRAAFEQKCRQGELY